jgi:hypothetical protein
MQIQPSRKGVRVHFRSSFPAIVALLSAVLSGPGFAIELELSPLRVEQPLGVRGITIGHFADATLSLAVEVDRDQARLLAFTRKERPFTRALDVAAPRAYADGRSVQLEFVLLGPAGERFTQRQEIGRLCLSHGPEAEPHVEGDTILLHNDTFIIELPAIVDWNRVELAYYETGQGTELRRALATEQLDPTAFLPTPANGSIGLSDRLETEPPAAPAASTVLWPEDFSDPDVYRVYGDAAEADRRVNIVIVPDGYTYDQKALMETHAQSMVDWIRTVTPYKEHDGFINYTLVYAYSQQSGADQCDCGTVVNTAMGTRFPSADPNCGSSSNRCLYYGNGCDTAGTGNIVLAELRAPAQDETIVMVNTSRYGGCGGARSVYSAANSSATDIAVHELGHSWAGLADEYAYSSGCGSAAGEVNTSLNNTDGAWPEWIDEIGAPREGAQYWQSCVYRPLQNCEMRALFNPFCPVCNQHWSLVTFGHFRVNPTAPIESMTPTGETSAWAGVPKEFSISTRLSSGPQIENNVLWLLYAPGSPFPSFVNTDTTVHSQAFPGVGTYVLEARLVADVNFVKPVRWGANVDVASWNVEVSELLAPDEISPPGNPEPLRFDDAITLLWEDGTDARAFSYNLYRGDLTTLDGSSYGSCAQSTLGQPEAAVPDSPAVGGAWYYLVTGVNPAGEGSMGSDSSGSERNNITPCAP